MELRHLRYFVAVADERSVSRAAARLAIAQPPLSQQIHRLEHELGFPLFERQSSGVVLTRAGEALLPHARDLLRAAADAAAVASAVHRGNTGRLVLGFINGAVYRVLPSVLRVYRAMQPNVEIAIRELISAEQVDAIRARRIDAGFLRPPVDAADLDYEEMITEPFVVALARDHEYARRRTLSLKDLHGKVIVAYPYGQVSGFRERIDAALNSQGVVPVVTHEATQLHTLCALAAANVGMAIVPESTMTFFAPGVCFARLRDLAVHAEIVLAWRKNDVGPQIAALVSAVREAKVVLRAQVVPPTPPASPASPAPRASRSAGRVPR